MQLFSADVTILLFAHENLKKLTPKIAHNRHNFFFSTALSCPYGFKLKIPIGNLAEAPSVISTLCPRPPVVSPHCAVGPWRFSIYKYPIVSSHETRLRDLICFT